MEGQEAQERFFLDTDWLAIGHIDEFLQLPPAENERNWVLEVDDPHPAAKKLEDTGIQTNGHGSIKIGYLAEE